MQERERVGNVSVHMYTELFADEMLGYLTFSSK